MLSADVKHILPMYTLAAGLWLLYAWRQSVYNKRIRARKRTAWLHERCMWRYLNS
jgi:hypothetical protein